MKIIVVVMIIISIDAIVVTTSTPLVKYIYHEHFIYYNILINLTFINTDSSSKFKKKNKVMI